MRRVFILIFLFFLFFTPKIQAQFEGTFGLGVHAGYGAEINSIGGGIHAHYYYTNNIRFTPSFTYFLERKGEGMWMTDADAHYIFPVSYSASLYPIAGLHYSQWKYDASKNSDLADEGWKIRANFELKYQFIPDYSQVVFSAGIGFWF